MDVKGSPYAVLAGAFALWPGVLFISAAAAKLASKDIGGSLSGYAALLPARLLRPVALSLPVVELATGAQIPRGDRSGAAMATALGLTFTVMAVSVLSRGLSVSCGCAGHGAALVSRATVARGIAITVGGLYLLREPTGLGATGSVLAAFFACIPAAGIAAARLRGKIDGRRAAMRRRDGRIAIEAEFARRGR